MADTGWVSPNTAANVSRSGATTWWEDVNDALADDEVYAYADFISETNGYSYWLRLTNYGFTIPSGATIDGIEVRVKRCAQHAELNTNYAYDSALYLRKASGQVGDNKASPTHWQTTCAPDEVAYYGGSADLWGASWSPSDINDSGFGVDLSCAYSGTEQWCHALVNVIEIKVYYTTSGWTGKIMGVTNPAKVMGVSSANISKIMGV